LVGGRHGLSLVPFPRDFIRSIIFRKPFGMRLSNEI